MAEKVPSWIERLLLPRLSEISGEIKALNMKVEALEKTVNTRIDALEKTFDERLTSLRNEMVSRFEAVNIRIDALEKRIPIIEELAGIKARLTDLERKISVKQR